ncbi:MAG: Flp pilus assembly complex ATPase component TadA [Gaiellales bacterium]|nr:Flp pilus assembly complex ATPase component TadA [Gaiellales bacterium]
MTAFALIKSTYGGKLRQAMESVVAELEPTPVEREQIMLLNRLFLSVLDAYCSHQLDLGPALDAHTSVMYAAAGQDEPRVLNVTLRGLVEFNSLTTAQARVVVGLVADKRTLLISGPAQSGKSTLLNAILQLLPRDSQVVAVEKESELPYLREKPFTLTLQAKPGTPAAAAAFTHASLSRPSCIIAGNLASTDTVSFLRALHPAFGLATLDSPDPEMSLAEWHANSPEMEGLLLKIQPVILHVERDQAGRPRLTRILETQPHAHGIRLAEIKPA